MLKVIYLFVILTLPMNLQASAVTKDAEYKSCNHHKFNFFFLKLYDIYLCVDDKAYLHPEEIFNTNFSLIINYNMYFSKDSLARSSVEEMSRYYDINKKEQNNYYNKLVSIFPNVKKDDVIEARYLNNGIISLYHNKILNGKISEESFSEMFLNIWLHKDGRHKKMTNDLFGVNE